MPQPWRSLLVGGRTWLQAAAARGFFISAPCRPEYCFRACIHQSSQRPAVVASAASTRTPGARSGRRVNLSSNAKPPNPIKHQVSTAPTSSKQHPDSTSRSAADAVLPKKTPDIKYLKLDLPQGDNSKIKKAVFIKSSVTVEDCPKHKLPEFAVIGRSNVGKSSLINCLTHQDKLARVSKDPGLTRCINHFLINDSWYLVDLPGYGYAKQSRKSRQEWLEFTQDFFLRRDNLCHVFLLVDASVPVQAVDVECANWLGETQVPFSIVFTKVDKSGKGGDKHMIDFKLELMKDWEAIPPCFETSSKTGAGRTHLQQYLAGLRKLYLTSK